MTQQYESRVLSHDPVSWKSCLTLDRRCGECYCARSCCEKIFAAGQIVSIVVVVRGVVVAAATSCG